eukprot:gene3842-2902_t
MAWRQRPRAHLRPAARAPQEHDGVASSAPLARRTNTHMLCSLFLPPSCSLFLFLSCSLFLLLSCSLFLLLSCSLFLLLSCSLLLPPSCSLL